MYPFNSTINDVKDWFWLVAAILHISSRVLFPQVLVCENLIPTHKQLGLCDYSLFYKLELFCKNFKYIM